MAQWLEIMGKVKNINTQNQLCNYYDGRYFDISVREILAEPIETILTHRRFFESDTDQILYIATNYVNLLIEKANEKLALLAFNTDNPMHSVLVQVIATFHAILNEPHEFYKYVLRGLSFERQLLATPDANLILENVISQKICNIFNEAKQISQKTSQYMQMISNYIKELENALLNQQEIQQRENNLQLEYMELWRIFQNLYPKTEEVQRIVLIDYLSNWKKVQCFSSADFINYLQLGTIQSWCEDLYTIISQSYWNIHQINGMYGGMKFDEHSTHENFKIIFSKFYILLETLVKSSFVIEKQPNQVIKTNTKFRSTIRFLVGNAIGKPFADKSHIVKAVTVSEASLRRVMASDSCVVNALNPQIDNNKMISNDTAPLILCNNSRAYIAEFKNMMMSKRYRDNAMDRRENETVMDRKMAVLFSLEVEILNNKKIRIHALSVPVVLMVHTQQEAQCWATITWSNAFYNLNDNGLSFHNEIAWDDLAKSLNQRAKIYTGKMRDLTPDNLNVLRDKLFNGNVPMDKMVTWKQFCKDKIGVDTFWRWFHESLKLIHDHLQGQWDENRIIGYITKQTSEELLRSSPVGTFLLRFSDSELGGLSIAFSNGNGMIAHVAPLNSGELNRLPLSERILQSQPLMYLYPGIPKAQCFHNTGTNSVTTGTNAGYIRMQLQSIIPGICAPAIFFAAGPEAAKDENDNNKNDLVELDRIELEQLLEFTYDESRIFNDITSSNDDALQALTFKEESSQHQNMDVQ